MGRMAFGVTAGVVLVSATAWAQPIAGLCDAPIGNCQNRPPEGEHALEFDVGRRFPAGQFKFFDQFSPAENGWIHEICWRGGHFFAEDCAEQVDRATDPDCGCVVTNPPDPLACDPALENGNCDQVPSPELHDANQFVLWQITIWSTTMGIPGEIIAGPFRGDFGQAGATDPHTGTPIAGGLTVMQAPTDEPVGLEAQPGFVQTEYSWTATFDPGAAPVVDAGECYWVEFDAHWVDERPCGLLLLASYESQPDGMSGALGIGDRRAIAWDASIRPTFELPTDLVRVDASMCLTLRTSPNMNEGDPVALLPVSTNQSCGARTVIAGDRIEDRVVLEAPQSTVEFDNSWATFDDSFPISRCDRQPILPIGDVWFQFATTIPDSGDPTVASVLLERSLVNPNDPFPDDLIMQVFRFVDPANPPMAIAPSDVEALACTRDGSLCLLNLPLNQTFLVRLFSQSPEFQGTYTLELQSPCPGRENDLCSGALEIPHDPMASGYGSSGGAIVFGDTTNATVDIGVPGGCDEPFEPQFDLPAFEGPIAHSGPGVWYRFTGMGNFVRISTNLPETTSDTKIAVYCSDDVTNPCVNLACIAGHEDIGREPDLTYNLNAEVEICAELGRDYFVLVKAAASSASGPFGLLVEELRDEFDLPIACAPTGDCAFECVFEIPAGAIDELTDWGPLSESCDESNIDGNNNGCDGPPNTQGNWQGLFPKIQVGDVVTGTLWAANGIRDVDHYIFENLPSDTSRAIVEFSWGAEAPIQIELNASWTNWFECPTSRFAPHTRRPSFCGDSGSFKTIVSHFGVDNDGVYFNEPGFKGTGGFELASSASATAGGQPCSVLNRYWLRLESVVPVSDCDPVPDPPGQPTIDNPNNPLMGDVTFGDWDDAAVQPSFDGSCGSSCSPTGDPDGFEEDHFAGEACGSAVVGIEFSGCAEFVPLDGDFMLLRADVPIVGWIRNCFSCAGAIIGDTRDWYRVSIPERSIVDLSIASGAPFNALLLSGTCADLGFEEEILGVAATRGQCGGRNDTFVDSVLLEPGAYNVVVRSFDLFSRDSVGLYIVDVFCDDEPFTKYVLQVSTSPAPQCAGDANGDGVVSFADITAVISQWGTDYNPRPGTGIGDADDDGTVNFGDITTILGNWLSVCS